MPEVKYNGLTFNYRPETTDWGIIQEACGGLYTRFFDVKPGELWFDIGAHIGSFTCYAANKQAFIYAFEPVPANYLLLDENVEYNNLDSWVNLYNIGVTGDGREIQLYVDSLNYGNCSLYQRGLTNTITVPTKPASWFNTFGDFCIKLDTEGCEHEILSALDLTKVNKLVFENHYWLQPEQDTLDIIDWIHKYFYHVEEYSGYMYYAWK